VLGSVVATVWGCSLLTSLDDLGPPETGADTSADTGAPPDVVPTESGTDSAVDAGTGLSDLSRWSAFDLTVLGGAPAGLWGGTFDGRYVYLTPSAQFVASSVMYRFDTMGSFTMSAGWSKFDVSSVGAGASNFAGTVFDGRYIYLAPTWSATDTARYDTTQPFTQSSSWLLYDPGSAFTFRQGATFDGRFAYFVPTSDTISQLDTSQSFTSATSWTSVNVSTFADAGTTNGFTGSVFDGRYAYFIPPSYPEYAENGTSGVVLRYDTKAPFGVVTSWSSFDTQSVSSAAAGFVGGAFDGRYVYAVPFQNNVALDGLVVRYDTQGPFGTASSWASFDMETLSTLATGFTGAVFDGRYMYFVPHGSGGAGLLARYDTFGAFTLAASWDTFDVHGVDVNAGGFLGAIFDGEFVYLVPGAGHVTVRFDTGQGIKPPERGGSFF
jgi:hypothetical protein